MIELIKGHIIEAKSFGDPVITENGYLVVKDGVLLGVYSIAGGIFQRKTDRLQREADLAGIFGYGICTRHSSIPCLAWAWICR